MAPSTPRTRATAALRMKQIALDNQDRTIRRLRAQLATERRGLAATKKELKETQVALEASHKLRPVEEACSCWRTTTTLFELVKRRVLDAATGCCDWMLRLRDQLWIEEQVEGATRRRLDNLKRCVSRIASAINSHAKVLQQFRQIPEPRACVILRRVQKLLLSEFSRAIVRSSAEVVFQIS
ncbi:GDSL esterase/lipase-like [Dorcoceras hygrometricum]|uniref:GDSL esterase/lipase-like n=1 Tax=Dorcoceras hygrometricum TaxID=472368 RepID=A0A2Z7C2V7_9LAMI|nr:GDSL esterase/lipase-like [Dorcoceras hygrometricum]